MEDKGAIRIPKAVKVAARLLVSLGATEVYLFGSHATGRARRGSDFDLAIKGLPPRKFYSAAGEVFEVIGHPMDIVDLDENTPFTRHLQDHGTLIRVA